MGIIGLIALWIFLYTYISQNEVYNWFPWSIKKRQIETMEQMVKANVDFEELKDYVQLNEYFI